MNKKDNQPSSEERYPFNHEDEEAQNPAQCCVCGNTIYPEDKFCSGCGRPASLAKRFERTERRCGGGMNVVYAPPEIMKKLFQGKEDE